MFIIEHAYKPMDSQDATLMNYIHAVRVNEIDHFLTSSHQLNLDEAQAVNSNLPGE